MLESWRWYGPSDPISLRDIRQAGAQGIVTALHELKCGELWSPTAISERVRMINEAGLKWVVVESIAVHEDIKVRKGNFQHYIEIYKQNIRNLAAAGINIICYNFMPILDWTRTDIHYPMPDGSSVLYCDADKVAAFDLFILKRSTANYPPDATERAKLCYQAMSHEQRQELSDSILLGLPGTVDDLSPEEFLTMLKQYQGIDDAALRQNLYAFLNEIMPTCEQCGVKMAIHPDDPPRPIFGLPRIMSNEADMQQLIDEVPSPMNGFTLCTGSLGGRQDNAPHLLMEKFAKRVFFAHFRNTQFEGSNPESFREADSHLCGHTDMVYAMQCLLNEETRRKQTGGADWEIPVRPDHGKLMDIDHEKHCYAGYSYGGRLIGLSELRGLAYALQHRPLPLIGQVAIVTGAAGVLCSVMVKSLLKAGAKVALLGRTKSKLTELQRQLAQEGLLQTFVVEADVLDKPSLEAASKQIFTRWGRLDILVNGAGGNDPRGTTPVEQLEPHIEEDQGFFGLDMEGFTAVNRLNMIGTILPSQVFGKLLLKTQGSIINISSMAAFQPLTKVGAYGAAKAAVDNFTKWLATHLAPMRVRVNAIAPGFFITDQNRFLMMEADGVSPTARGRKVLAKTPMHRFGDPEDLCSTLQYLVSDGAKFVTGVIIPVDGGFLAYSGV